ncbi:hypothetical protein [Paenibacillus sp. NFR01]|uniref:hypothetical protein n=1 Tax=Paenibacillus sp. NFR01 TaxID=1566279 RepID=UPI0008D595FA|nr:hypothetical protein [Paenibacillus sp. NFR01]SEU18469.1 hypothetical protein SAMN03159358_3792 [Paenibacillus sp. NFR01]
MTANSHKDGMKAAAAMFEEKFRTQGEAIDRVGARLSSDLEQIAGLQEDMITIAEAHEALLAEQSRERYGLDMHAAVEKCDVIQKELLAGILLSVAAATEEPSALQQAYFSSVLQYLGILYPSSGLSLKSVERIDSRALQKQALHFVLEYKFLERSSFEFIADYEAELACFSIRRDELDQIMAYITLSSQAMGPSGLAEKYRRYAAEEGLDFIETGGEAEGVKDAAFWEQKTEISGLCADLVNVNAYIETGHYLVYENNGLRKIHKAHGKDVLIKSDVYFSNLKRDVQALKDQLFYYDSRSEALFTLDLDTHKEKKLLACKIRHFQVKGHWICYETDETRALNVYDLRSNESTALCYVRLGQKESLHRRQLDVETAKWLFTGTSVFFIPAYDAQPADDVNSSHYLYRYDLSDETVNRVCKITKECEDFADDEEYSRYMGGPLGWFGFGGEIEWVLEDGKVLLLRQSWNQCTLDRMDLNSSAPECETLAKVTGKGILHNGSLFYAEENHPYPLYKLELDSKERVQMGDHCGYAWYGKKRLFKDPEKYHSIHPFQVTGNWLYFKRGQGYDAPVMRVSLDEPMQMTECKVETL